MSNPTLGQITASLRKTLSPIYGEGEAKAMIRLIFHNLKGWNQTQMIMNEDTPLSDYILFKVNAILERLLKHEPIQYILGEAYFYGMNLKVDRSTLIPRPETEELTDLIVNANREDDLRVLDIGTGSGAIAIALSRNLPYSKVTAIDISADALNIATENAKNLHADIHFIEEDVFTYFPAPGSFDIIVSNPPYIDESEKASMESNVLDYEPHGALFVPDSHPLIYYSRILEIASTALTANGRLYFEINPRHAAELKAMTENEGFSDVNVIKDIHGKERFVTATKP